MGQLAALLTASEEFARAERLHREFLAGREQTLGFENSKTLLARFALAENLFLQGQLDESIPLTEAVLTVQRRNIGAEHEETIDSLSLLGRSFHRLGAFEEARKLSQEALESARQVLPPTHWKIGWLLSNHGDLLADCGDIAAAREHLAEGVKLLKAALGESHPKVEFARNRMQGLIAGQ
jgi:tetratricopeptide (TPR) repeat protein